MHRSSTKASSFRRALIGLPLLAAAPVDVQSRIDALVGGAGVAMLDPRTQHECAATPVVEWYGSLHRAVTVTCAGPPAWRQFVPVRPASGGIAVAVPAPLQPVVVRRGDTVQIASGGAGFQVSAAGAAEQDGRVGARIRVRNLATGVVTTAVVEDAGNVSMPGYSSAAAGR